MPRGSSLIAEAWLYRSGNWAGDPPQHVFDDGALATLLFEGDKCFHVGSAGEVDNRSDRQRIFRVKLRADDQSVPGRDPHSQMAPGGMPDDYDTAEVEVMLGRQGS